ncbi:hypothetical protein AAFP30_21645 [Gordonia sp. CPCC 205515]|uniref:hypothetical protein n=1 Tax=Gordonia sp. CPCC 205515 TaxID=3140791 RepID=UPI003AF3F49E
MPVDQSALDDIIDELYGAPPAEFVARRTEFVKAARADGNRRLAQSVSKLRRPTQVASAVNLWARTQPDEIEALTDLAQQLTDAQRKSAADRLRALSARRQELVATATSAVAVTAADAGARLSDNALREVGQTLRAALADEQVLDDVRRGRLTTSAEYSGFGPSGLFVVPDIDTTPPVPDPDPALSDDDAAQRRAELLAEARDLLSATTAAEAEARATEQHRAAAAADLTRQVGDLETQLDELRAELTRREDELRFARRQAEVAERDHEQSRTALDDAQRQVTRARHVVDSLSDEATP